MVDKILIANRGEIACRIIRTARRLGIGTVAVYSEADRDALHVRSADEAICIGPAPSARSYLDAAAILAAARDTGADAIHPGFGFLSENARFSAQVREQGIVFLGPPDSAISAMGDKIESKRLAERAGVSTIPGHLAALRDADEASAVARDIGYPVMLKASAGGGGKGMRVAWSDDEVREGFNAAASEARSSFGDDRVFAEKFIERPRHIEIQILADQHGNVVHLGERECSIQRRHQKVLEEAPSPFIDPETRAAMGAEAVALARAVGYESAGTVEFVVDPQRRFYFLEMNTRLQVEHPVTELVTGLDLVELMIRVGEGKPLPFGQDDVRMTGWAIEARIYAEDPERGFLPATGRLSRYRPPPETPSVRVDTGVDEGGEISVYYDPMIAKLVTSGATRADAIDEMARALDSYTIRGLAHNIAFLAAVVRHERFRAGDLSTAFIDEEYPDGFRAVDAPHEDPLMLVCVAAYLHWRLECADATVGRPGSAHSAGGGADASHRPYVGVLSNPDREEIALEVQRLDASVEVITGERRFRIDSGWSPGQACLAGEVNGHPVAIQIERDGPQWRLTHGGHAVVLRVMSPRAAQLNRLMPIKRPPDLSKYLLSPMPGLLLRLAVAAGEPVKAGQVLAVVEAMKMENVLVALQDVTVAAVLCAEGDSLAVDQPIVEFE